MLEKRVGFAECHRKPREREQRPVRKRGSESGCCRNRQDESETVKVFPRDSFAELYVREPSRESERTNAATERGQVDEGQNHREHAADSIDEENVAHTLIP